MEKNLLKRLDKYYIYAVSSKKAVLLASSNSKTQLRDQTLDKLKLGPDGDKSQANKYSGLYLYRIKLMKVSKKDIEKESDSQIKMIGGPIVAVVERVKINVGNKIKLKSIDDNEVRNKIYFSPVYLEKYKTIKQKSIDSIAFDFAHDKFNSGLFAVNTLND